MEAPYNHLASSMHSGYLDTSSSFYPQATTGFSNGSPSHYQNQFGHFLDRGGPPNNLPSSSSAQATLPHATGLASSDPPPTTFSHNYPEDIWGVADPVHGHAVPIIPIAPDSTHPFKGSGHQLSIAGPSSSSSLSTLAEMAIFMGSGGRDSSKDQSPQGYSSEDPGEPDDDSVQLERKHACSMCHKRFDRPSTLKKHFLVHTGEKAFQCDTCGRRFGVASNLNRHVRKCVLKPVHGAPARSASVGHTVDDSHTKKCRSSPADSQSISASPPSPRKRRRRVTASSIWIPQSLRNFNLQSEELRKSASVPLPPVVPSPYEERDSYDENFGLAPYHPDGWHHRLPGPWALNGGFGGRDIGNYPHNGGGGYGRLLVF